MTKRERPEIKPSVDFPLSGCSEELTGFETIELEKRFGRMDSWGTGTVLTAFVWAFEKRTNPQITIEDVKGRSTRELKGFFAPEPDDELDDEDSPKD